jgi:GTPase SAR1 family protein
VEQCPSSVSVMLVGNKIDQAEDRMVTHEEGERRSRELGCDQFREISVREQVDVPRNVVEQLYTHWKHGHHAVKFKVNRCLLESI